ncbi:MAG: hypothetical protein CSA62_02240 [Planctomycetota bacterium]|nr:MAG: hypothetical protein CSA62_02240 [Planctomycetota bacterium]
MYVTEKFRPAVIVPLDDVAARELEALEVSDGAALHVVSVDIDAELAVLHQSGFLEAVGEATGCLLGEYEEDLVPAAMVSRVRKLAMSFGRPQRTGVTGRYLFAQIVEACEIAEARGYPICFVF